MEMKIKDKDNDNDKDKDKDKKFLTDTPGSLLFKRDEMMRV